MDRGEVGIAKRPLRRALREKTTVPMAPDPAMGVAHNEPPHAVPDCKQIVDAATGHAKDLNREISAEGSTSEQFEDRAWLAQVRRTLWLAARLRFTPVLAAVALPARGPVRATWRTLRLTFVAGDSEVASDVIRGAADPACAGRRWLLPPDRNCCRIAGILKSGNQKQLAKQFCLLAAMASRLNCREADFNLSNNQALSTGVM